MKIKLITSLFIFSMLSCKSSMHKVELINSKANLPVEIINDFDVQPDSMESGDDFSIDLIIQQLLKNKSVVFDFDKRELFENLNFESFNDTIPIVYLDVLSPSGGVPLTYSYDVEKGDQIFFKLKNERRNRLKKFEIKEDEDTRFIVQNFKKRDSVSSSFTARNDGKINIEISNNSKIKNLGFFKSRLKIELRKLSNFSVKSEIIYDTIPRKRKTVQIKYDTLFHVQEANQLFLGSKRNFSKPSSSTVSLYFPEEEKIISWSYWIGLRSNDSISNIQDDNNPLYIFSKNEINKQKTDAETMSILSSTNDDITLNFTNHTFDRRSLNFSPNYATFIVDNDFTSELAEKAEIEIMNTSKVNDYKLNFMTSFLSLVTSKIEIEEEYLEIVKKVKLSID